VIQYSVSGCSNVWPRNDCGRLGKLLVGWGRKCGIVGKENTKKYHPFADRTKTSPHFYFSRKMTLDAAMALLSHPVDPDEEFTHTRLRTGGFFEESNSRASSTIELELINQISEYTSTGLSRAGENAGKPLHDALELLGGVREEGLSLALRRMLRGICLCVWYRRRRWRWSGGRMLGRRS
jgi:hypothetical protein